MYTLDIEGKKRNLKSLGDLKILNASARQKKLMENTKSASLAGSLIKKNIKHPMGMAFGAMQGTAAAVEKGEDKIQGGLAGVAGNINLGGGLTPNVMKENILNKTRDPNTLKQIQQGSILNKFKGNVNA